MATTLTWIGISHWRAALKNLTRRQLSPRMGPFMTRGFKGPIYLAGQRPRCDILRTAPKLTPSISAMIRWPGTRTQSTVALAQSFLRRLSRQTASYTWRRLERKLDQIRSFRQVRERCFTSTPELLV